MTEQLVLNLGFRTALEYEDFLVSPCNEEAVGWLDEWPEWPSFVLAIVGDAGCGKTHLANVFKAKNPDRTVIKNIKDITVENIPDILGEADNIVVEKNTDDFDETALFHLYNAVKENNGYLLITSREAPARWNVKLADLCSRMSSVHSVFISSPDDELVSAVLVKMFSDRQIEVGQEVIKYIVHNTERSFAAIRNIVEKADALSMETKRKITIPLIKEVIVSYEQPALFL